MDNISKNISHVAVSSIFFLCCYAVSSLISPFIKSFTLLKSKEKVFWHMTILRAVFGIFGTYVGLWAIFSSHGLSDDVVWSSNEFTRTVMSITVGFFIFETAVVTSSDLYYGNFQVLLNIHHWLGLVSYSAGLAYGCTQYLACVGLLLEMTTPSSAICWTLLKCNHSKSLLWKGNQFLLVHLFHLRSVVEVYLWYLTYQNWPYIYEQMPTLVFVLNYTGLVLVTFVMTPYWTYRKTQQLITPFDFNFQPVVINGVVNHDKKDS